MQSNIRKLSFHSIFIAIFILFTFIPYLGYWKLGVISITLMHILLSITIFTLYYAFKTNPIITGLGYGFLFGLTSLIHTYIFPDVTTFIFGNPLFSVVPRMIMGLLLGITIWIFEKLQSVIQNIPSQKKHPWWKTKSCFIFWGVTASLASIYNTVFTLLFMQLLGPVIFKAQFDSFQIISWIVLLVNFLPENIVGIILLPPILYALRSLYK